MMTAIAYSALDEGERPFGDTAIRSFFDDAGDLARALPAENPAEAVVRSKDLIGEALVEYAGLLALNQVLGSSRPTAADGVLSVSESGLYLTLNLSDAAWTFGSAIHRPLHVHDLISDAIGVGAIADSINAKALAWYSEETNQTTGNIYELVKAISYQIGTGAPDALPFVQPTDLHVTVLNGGNQHLTNPVDGRDMMIGSTGQDLMNGGAGVDILIGNDGDDVLEGGAGNDWFFGGAGNDTIWGGDAGQTGGANDGDDTVDYSAISSGMIRVVYNGTSSTSVINVQDNQGGNDTLRSVETVIATSRHDIFKFSGDIPAGLVLTLDAGGGQARSDILNFFGHSAGIALVTDGISGTVTSAATGGVINLINFHTDIIASAFDDTITDNSSGDKRIDGGEGDDVITVATGAAMINGGEGDDTINGGAGNDVLYGGDGDDLVSGGEGSDRLIASRGDDILEGGAGSDWLEAGPDSGGVARGGAGNDVIDAQAGGSLHIEFGQGDGNDMVLGVGSLIQAPTIEEAQSEGAFAPVWGDIDIRINANAADVTVVWQAVVTDSRFDGYTTEYALAGDVAIVLVSGESIFLGHVIGYAIEGLESLLIYTMSMPRIVFNDAIFHLIDATPPVEIVIGSVAQYRSAVDDYQAERVGDPASGNLAATAGDDDLEGGRGDDNIDAGEGDDAITSSGGNDVVDGGAGNDTLTLFGSRESFEISLDEAGALVLRDLTGLEGEITAQGVENFYFAGDDATFTADTLFDHVGTEGDDLIFTGDGRQRLFGLGGNDFLESGAGDDLIEGGAGNDILDGGEGVDTMIGGSGNDVYVVDDAADSVTENPGEGTDEVQTLLAAYTLGANFENLTGYLATGHTLTGNALNNVLMGWTGADTLDGAGGSDTASYAWSSAPLTIDLQTGEKTGDAAPDTFISIENLTGGSGGDTLRGTSAANVLDGGLGVDTLVGRGGNDIYYVDDSGDVVIETANQGTDEVRTTLGSYTLGANVENLRGLALTAQALTAQALTGNTLANTLTGGAGDDTLAGLAGNDTLDGGLGADQMQGGAGNDIYLVDNAADAVTELAGQGTDEVRTALATLALAANLETLRYTGTGAFTGTGNELNNVLYGKNGDDTLSGGDGSDTLVGLAGADTLIGGEGHDTLDGGTGADRMEGGAGSDVYTVDSAADVLVEAAGAGTDSVYTTLALFELPADIEDLTFNGSWDAHGIGNALDNAITSSSGNDVLEGHDGNDSLRAGSGDDVLDGGAGDDLLVGGPGADVMTGGAGADIFQVSGYESGTGAAADLIADFLSGTDRIDLSGMDADLNVAGNQAFAFIGEGLFTSHAGELRTLFDGGETRLQGDTNGDGLADFEIVFAGTQPLPVTDFVL